MRLLAAILIQLVFCNQLRASEICSGILDRNHHQEFGDLREKVEVASDSAVLNGIAHKWIKEGVARRDLALSCMTKVRSENQKRLWRISYAYRFLADTLQPLVDSGIDRSTENFRREILERIDGASENLDYKYTPKIACKKSEKPMGCEE